MASQPESSETVHGIDKYWRTRDFKTSARLHLQHWLFQSTVGFILMPSIRDALAKEEQTSDRPLRVADLGCGNGAWLFECAALLPPSAQLYGFDIQPAHFPAARDIPGNVKLSNRDILDANLPDDVAGSFDVVHIRAFGSVIRNSDCTPVLKAVDRLLRPGGWVQWEEADTSAMTASAGEGVAGSCIALLKVIEAGGKATGTTFDWFATLGEQFATSNFQNTNLVKFPLKSEQYKAWTEDYLLVYEEIAYMLPSEKDVPGAPMTREKYEALFDQVVKETGNGAVIHSQHLVVVTGQKSA